jgi:hypothetical protein
MAKILKEGEKSRFTNETPPQFDKGWLEWRQENLSTPELLQKLPFIGPVTCYHLARNIGLLDVVKPDLHLERLAAHWGFDGSLEMCRQMQAHWCNHFETIDGERVRIQKERPPLGIIDLCVWYLASTFGTKELRKEGER